MPTRISADVGDHLCFFTFYLYDPYWLQNYKFYLAFKKITVIISPNY